MFRLIRYTFYFLILGSLSLVTFAQVHIKPLPSTGYEDRIRQFVDDMIIIDTHEHLLNPMKIEQYTSLDFTLLLNLYSQIDIRSAGMSSGTFKMLMKDSLSISEKWQILKPYWESSQNTAFNRVALLAADKLFGIKDINEYTVSTLSDKIKTAYQNDDWFNKVLIEKCKIEYLIQDDYDHNRNFGNARFRYVERFDAFIKVNSKESIVAASKNLKIETLDEFVKALEMTFNNAMSKGIVGVKTFPTGSRIIYFENVSKERAEEVFSLIMNSGDRASLSFEIVKQLQDYMMHRLLDLAQLNKLPVAIHTGFLSGISGLRITIDKTNAIFLANLFSEYPYVNFVLYHGSFPYSGELTTLAKNYKNVYIDMCWLYTISPSYSERYLHEWIETVPISKLMAFGGDYNNIENVYAHLLFAKEIIARVLITKVRDCYISESEAIYIARQILHDNAMKLYKL